MKKPEIETLMSTVVNWNLAPEEVRGEFIKRMEDCQYGWDALTQAWAWFLAGWSTAIDKPELVERKMNVIFIKVKNLLDAINFGEPDGSL